MVMNDPGVAAAGAAAMLSVQRVRLFGQALDLERRMNQTARRAHATLVPARQRLQQHISAYAAADTQGAAHDLRPLALALLDYTLAFEGEISDLLDASADCLGAIAQVLEVTDEEISASADALIHARTTFAALGGTITEGQQQ